MFTDYFFPELGGIQDSIATISRALGRRGHQVDIYAPRYAAHDYRRIGAPVARARPGRQRARAPAAIVTVPQHHPAIARGFAVAARLGGAGAAREPDVIHVHSFFGIGLEALLDGACLGIPVIGTNHTTIAGLRRRIIPSASIARRPMSWVLQPMRLCDRAVPFGVRRTRFRAALPAAPGGFQPDRHRPVHAGARGRTRACCGRGSACADRRSPMPAGSGRRRISTCCCSAVAIAARPRDRC